RLCRAEAQRPRQLLLLRRQAAGADPRLYAHAGFPGIATRREPDRLCACREQFHPRADDAQRAAQPQLADHIVHRIHRRDEGRHNDPRRRQARAEAPPAVRRHPRRGGRERGAAAARDRLRRHAVERRRGDAAGPPGGDRAAPAPRRRRHRSARRRDGCERGRGLSRHQEAGQPVIPPAAPARSIHAPSFSTSRFRAEREADWIAFDLLLTKLEKKGAKALTSDELLQLPILYRATLSSLSIARATSLDKALLDHLEALSIRGYFLVYGVRESRGS